MTEIEEEAEHKFDVLVAKLQISYFEADKQFSAMDDTLKKNLVDGGKSNKKSGFLPASMMIRKTFDKDITI